MMTSPSTSPTPAAASAHRAPLSPRAWLALAGWLLLCFIAAGVGSVASVQAPQFYAQLVQPPWPPPPGVFGPVWSVLYTLMGIAAWLVWREPAGAARRHALALFCVQLAVNALWSWLFFQWHLGAWALADIALLGACVAATFVAFLRLRPLAGLLLLPYLAWISFAAALSYTLWRMNPGLLG
ncbi:TspO/MBR family protein [Paracidovorax cattleyae]|uniref:TspO and MBR related proteins n=1 Tax=Paracidovorax cattleyae TaxID=80868 RepID=A0A1H0VYJ9_9BURK|nr:TspO/MBR family protein [Paracidovorax cattleyae]AVS72976.1 tryptophan-rich sensory protein [Paracidovorax cattleyae]SDP83318.1 TspO and MBR related proteins [Paracidovorax cattleyae]